MGLYVLRPNANWNGESLFSTPGPLEYAALADNSDVTYIQRSDLTVPASYEAEFTTQELSANEIITSVNLKARFSTLSSDSLAQFSIGVITDRNGRTVSYSIPISKQGIYATSTYDLGIKLTSAPNGAAWTQTLIDNLIVKFSDGATGSTVLLPDPDNRTTLYALYIEVQTEPRPTLTVLTPTGTVTDTSFPSVTWAGTFANGLSESQAAYEIKIFDSATYTADGFSPDTSEPVLKTGVITSTNAGQTLEGDLANSTTYRAYVRVASAVNGQNYFSDWAFSEFALSIDSPATPTVSAFYNSTTGAVTVTVFGRTNALSANQSSFETDTSGWEVVSNCSISRNTTQHSSGSASLAILSASAGEVTIATNINEKFAVSANNKFAATAEFKSEVTSRSCYVGIVWINNLGAEISTVYGSPVSSITTAWKSATVSGTAPTGATHAVLILKIESTGAAETHYVDKVAFHAGDTATWTKGGFKSFSFVVERSDNGGLTYNEIRNSPVVASASQIATIDDYEIPLDTTVTYRAKARAEI